MKKILMTVMCIAVLAGCTAKQGSMENKVYDAIMTRTSVRQFTGEALSKAQIDTLLQAAMAAPSAINKQPWAFIVVDDKALIERIGEELPNSRCQNNAPCAIVPCGDLSKAIEGEGRDFWVNDVSAATENILLAAHSVGLGAVWTGIWPGTQRIAKTQALLQLPEHIIPLCIIPIGYPAEQPAIKDKFNTDNIHYNRW